MMTRHNFRLIAVGLTALATMGAARDAKAQEPAVRSVPGRIAVVVALVERAPQGAETLIVRQPGGTTSNVIVVVDDPALAVRIGAAALTLASVIREEGAIPAQRKLIRVPDGVVPPEAELAAAARVAARVRAATSTTVRGVGQARTAVIYLPDASAGRSKSAATAGS